MIEQKEYVLPSTRRLDQVVRCGFILRGTTLSAWSKARGISHDKAQRILVGLYKSDDGEILKLDMIRDAGVTEVGGSVEKDYKIIKI